MPVHMKTTPHILSAFTMCTFAVSHTPSHTYPLFPPLSFCPSVYLSVCLPTPLFHTHTHTMTYNIKSVYFNTIYLFIYIIAVLLFAEVYIVDET